MNSFGQELSEHTHGREGCLCQMVEGFKALKKDDQIYGQKVAEMAKKHSSEAFYALDDSLEAAVFLFQVDMIKEAL